MVARAQKTAVSGTAPPRFVFALTGLNVNHGKGTIMESILPALVLLGAFAAWIALQMWVLPRFGIKT